MIWTSLAKLFSHFINSSLHEFAYFSIINLFMRESSCSTSVDKQHLFWQIKPHTQITNNYLKVHQAKGTM